MAEPFLDSYLVACLVLFFASVLQCAVGFGSGLLLTPVLLFAGWTLPQVVAVSITARIVQNFFGAYRLKDEFDWKKGFRPNLIRMLSLPVGILVLKISQDAGKLGLQQIVGCVILLYVIILGVGKVRKRESLHFIWEAAAMTASGFLLGFCGMGGPPLAMWVDAHGWPGDKMRSFMFHSFSITAVPHAIILLLAFEKDVLFAAWIGFLALPAVFIGAMVGMRIGNAMPDRILRTTTLCVLGAIALRAIFQT